MTDHKSLITSVLFFNQKSKIKNQKFIFCVLILLFLAGCFRNPVTHRREARIISEKAEREIGRETNNRLIDMYGELKEPVLREYVYGLGKKLAAVSDRPHLDFEFTILDSEMINAFAAPGGYIFVTSGLLDAVNSEAELATILGHEIGHVCAWHSVNMIEKQMGLGALAALGTIATAMHSRPEAVVALMQSADLFSSLYMLGYSREHEREADRVGLRYAISAGYNPRAALAFFEYLESLEKKADIGEWESYLRSHPPTGERIVLARQYIERMDAFERPFVEGKDSYQEMKARLPRLPAEHKGQITGRRYHHAGWGIFLEVPSGWKWEPQNQQSLASFRYSGAWGELRRFPLKKSMRPLDLAKRIGQKKKWHFLNGHDILYPAGYAFLGYFYGPGILGGTYHYRALFVVREKTGYMLLCAAPHEKMTEYLVPFEQIMRSFQIQDQKP